MYTCVGRYSVATTWGEVVVFASVQGVVAVRLPSAKTDDWDEHWPLCADPCAVRDATAVAKVAALGLREFLEGQSDHLLASVDFSATSVFRRAVYSALQQVPPGGTVTYGALAKRAGHEGKARAVGAALAANPTPVFVPCHRVVAAGGLGGWSGPLGWKERLLELERRGQA